jgi:hypothetical protein
MLSSSMYFPSRSLHRSMWIFHCSKQCCRSSSGSLFMSSVTFASTSPADFYLVHFNTDLSFGNKKSHVGLGQVSTVGVPTQWSCALSKSLDRQGIVCQCIASVKNPSAVRPYFTSSSFSSSSSQVFTKGCQNLLVEMVNGLNFRHPILVNNPSTGGGGTRTHTRARTHTHTHNHHHFKFGFSLPYFLLPWWIGALPVHELAPTFWVILKKPWFITSYYIP